MADTKQRYSIGLDYGTNSCRSVLVRLNDGAEIATRVFAYPTGTAGIVTDPREPHLARQHPRDYLDGLDAIVRGAIEDASGADENFSPDRVVGIGVDTTGSTPLPVNAGNVPLAMLPRFASNPAAMAWLWKDHTGHAEAAEITAAAADLRPEYLAKCGGTYSSEWFWSKILHLKRTSPDVFAAAASFVECCDFVPAALCGITDPSRVLRSVCAAGHKAMYSDSWGGLPDAGFLSKLDPALAGLRDRLYTKAVSSDMPAGTLCREWATRLGLREGITVAVGAFDAHMGAVGAGIAEGRLVKILGTSSCDMIVVNADRTLADIPGVCGIVKGSILPGQWAIEAGQSAVGDIFLWLVEHLTPERYGKTKDEKFAALQREAAGLAPGEHGLLALDWNNGNRTVLVDPLLTGLIMGQTLHTTAAEIFKALIEATAFGALTIIRRIGEYDVPVHEVTVCGGLASKSPMLLQVYADVLNMPLTVSRSDQTCALGAAIFGAVAAGRDAGGYASAEEAQKVLCGKRGETFTPDSERAAVYSQIYALYSELHDTFGTAREGGSLRHVMKKLLELRSRTRA